MSLLVLWDVCNGLLSLISGGHTVQMEVGLCVCARMCVCLLSKAWKSMLGSALFDTKTIPI